MKKKYTEAEDRAYDKKHGIKEGSKRDKALDKKRGLKDSSKKKKLVIAIGIMPKKGHMPFKKK